MKLTKTLSRRVACRLNIKQGGGTYHFAWNPKATVNHAIQIRRPDRIMVAKNEFHQGRAVWYFEVGTWACKSADDCLKFLLKKSESQAQLELTRRGFSWKWL